MKGSEGLRNITTPRNLAILLSVARPLIWFSFLASIYASEASINPTTPPHTNTDKLAYVSEENQLIVYDPVYDTYTPLLDDVSNFLFSPDGRVAFNKVDDPHIYIFDPAAPDLAPINITQKIEARSYAEAWSIDGSTLVFEVYAGEIYDPFLHDLYVWDGETTLNIMPDEVLDTPDYFYVSWSFDGRLAFTVNYGWSSDDTPSEIYLWDGEATTNLSQNPYWEDGGGGVIWSKTGQLMFHANLGEGSAIYVWDGVSFKDGSPDVESFTLLAPELKPYSAGWMDDGSIAFTVLTQDWREPEIIIWDFERKNVIKRIPVASDKGSSWLAEGDKVILSSILASGIPSVYLDVENTEGDILFSTHTGAFSWSADGYLAFCGIENRNISRALSIWDGEETRVVARVTYKPAAWHSTGHTFSCNNG